MHLLTETVHLGASAVSYGREASCARDSTTKSLVACEIVHDIVETLRYRCGRLCGSGSRMLQHNAQRLREGGMQAAVEMSPLPRQGRAAAATGSRQTTAAPPSTSGAIRHRFESGNGPGASEGRSQSSSPDWLSTEKSKAQ